MESVKITFENADNTKKATVFFVPEENSYRITAKFEPDIKADDSEAYLTICLRFLEAIAYAEPKEQPTGAIAG